LPLGTLRGEHEKLKPGNYGRQSAGQVEEAKIDIRNDIRGKWLGVL